MGDGFFELIIVVILFLSSIPFIFQFKYGSRALWGWTKLPFWQIFFISLISQLLIATIITALVLIIDPIDGIYYVFSSMFIGVGFLVLILILILFQWMINKSQN